MKIEFQKEECSRCGGSGKMPYAVYGGVCFKCKGKGQMFSRAGRAAYKRVRAVQEQVCSVPASSLKVGDRILAQGRVQVLEEVKVRLGKGNGASLDPISHEPVSLIFGDTALKAKSWSMSGPAHRSVLKAWNSETLAVAAEAVKKMKGATVLP